MTLELKEVLLDLLDDLQNGWELCLSKGMAGYDLPKEANDYIRKLIEKDLEAKEFG